MSKTKETIQKKNYVQRKKHPDMRWRDRQHKLNECILHLLPICGVDYSANMTFIYKRIFPCLLQGCKVARRC